MTDSSISTFFGLDVSALQVQWSAFRRRISQRYLLLEFRNNSLLFCEVYIHKSKINYLHVDIQLLPEGSVELGVPVDPVKMSGLLLQLCKEKKINVHRCAVVLPPEASFVSLVRLPASLSSEEAWDFVQSPESGLQIPISLQQTDFDLTPLQHLWKSDDIESPYLLSGVPRTLVDSLIETLNLAEFELCDLSLAMTAQSRLLCSRITSLDSSSYVLLLEFYPECTNAVILSASGPVSVSRLASIREFPEPDVSEAILGSALEQSLAAESMILADDRYLPISELDLQVLVHETKALITDFKSKNLGCLIDHVYITGAGSSHPGVEPLLQKSLGLSVSLLRVSEASGIGTISMDSLLLSQSLGRLLGLGLHLISDQTLLDGVQTSLDQSISPSAEPTKITPLFDNPWLLSSPANPWLLSAPSETEFNQATCILTPMHDGDQSGNYDHSKVDFEESTYPRVPSISSSSLKDDSAFTSGADPLDVSADLDANGSSLIESNNPWQRPDSVQLESQNGIVESGIDDSVSINESDVGDKRSSVVPTELDDTNLDLVLVDQPILEDDTCDEGVLSFSQVDQQNETDSMPSILSSSLVPLGDSIDLQELPIIHENSLDLKEEQDDMPVSLENLGDDRDRAKKELSTNQPKASFVSDQIVLGNETNEWPSILKSGEVDNIIELFNESELQAKDFVEDVEVNQVVELDSEKGTTTISQNEKMNWPSIRDQQTSSDNEVSNMSSTSPYGSINPIDVNENHSTYSGSSNTSSEVDEDQIKAEDLDTTELSVVSDQELQEGDDSFGELRFSDD